MTQRDWQNDMDFCKSADSLPLTSKNIINLISALPYWLQEAKERGEREQRLKEAIENALKWTWYHSEANMVEIDTVLNDILDTLYPDTPAQPSASTPEITARPIDDWHEDYGDVIWWTFPIQESPYCGSPLDMDWPGYHTHWTPIMIPAAPAPKEGETVE
ncbi:hypothetical protein [Paenibacillus sp. FSL R10-2771]|uniref:hypothetical protein n=1 Tax=Paenibacillus sp. FSL R10-2771 TaxID=2954693 RepID=UPI0030F93AF7